MLRCPHWVPIIAVTVIFIILASVGESGAVDLVGAWNPTFVQPGIPLSPEVLGVADGHLYAAARRHPNGPWFIFRWDDRWVEVGSANGRTIAMAEWDGCLLLAGEFTMVNGHPCRRLAILDGDTWSEFGGGVVGTEIRSLLAVGDTLYVGGTFAAVGGVPANNVAAWSAGEWSSLDAGLPFTVTGLGLRTGLVVASQSSTLVPDAGVALQAWDGSSWTHPFPEPPNWASVMAVTDDILAIGCRAADSYLYVLDGEQWIEHVLEDDAVLYTSHLAIAPYLDGVVVAYNVYGWYQDEPEFKYWNGVGLVDLPADHTPNDVVLAVLPQGDRLLFGGDFDQVGATTALRVAALADGDVEVFHRSGNGFTGTPVRLGASGDRVVIGGAPLGSTANTNLGMVADWSGHDWQGWEYHHLHYDLTSFRDIASYPDHVGIAISTQGEGVNRYRSSYLLDGESSSGWEYCEAICYYDGSWVTARYSETCWGGALVDGIPGGFFDGGRIVEMIPCAQGLAVCGNFDNCNDLARENITIWDGTNWQDLAGGLAGTVIDLLEWEGRLLAAGSFTIAQSGQPAQVAAWDGQHWEVVLAGANGEVTSVAEHQGYLFAGGTFTKFGERPIRHLAIRDTDGSWWEFGGGADLAVTSLGSSRHGLWLIGDFTEVGGIESYHVAVWEGDFVAVELSGFAAAWVADVATIAWRLGESLGVQASLRLERERGGVGQLVREFEPDVGELTFNVADPAGIAGDLYRLYKSEGGGAPHLAAEATLGPRPVVAGGLCLAVPAPNPANPGTTIAFATAEAGRVSLAVYDLRGRRLRVIADEIMGAGSHEIVWDGRDSSGREAPSGTYVVRLGAGGEVRREKVSLLR